MKYFVFLFFARKVFIEIYSNISKPFAIYIKPDVLKNITERD